MNYSERFFDLFMGGLDQMGIGRRRSQLLRRASGTILEVGAGTGTNLEHYNPDAVQSLTVTDLAVGPLLRRRAAHFAHVWGRRDDLRVGPADLTALPFDDETFDTVVVTLVLCSIPDQELAASEIRRVLRRDGRLLFLEHVRPPGRLGQATDRINPAWHTCTGDCQVNRRTVRTLTRAGFTVDVARSAGGLLACGVATP